jgi:hypothetical protein
VIERASHRGPLRSVLRAGALLLCVLAMLLVLGVVWSTPQQAAGRFPKCALWPHDECGLR